MSLGVRFKFCLAIWASWQVLSPTHGLKMQVTNLSSSPKPLSESDLNLNAISSSQVVKNAKVLPNVPIKKLNSLSSPTNILEPIVNVPNVLSTPCLKYDNVIRSWNNNAITLNPQGNVIDAVLVETTPYNNGINSNYINSELNSSKQPDYIPDLTPSANNIVPSARFANMFGNNNNNCLVQPGFGTHLNSHAIVQNSKSTNEIINPLNPIHKFSANAPNIQNARGTLSNLNTLVPDIPVAENEVLPNTNEQNILKNIPRIHSSFGPIFNSNPNIPATIGAENKLIQPINNANILNSFLKETNTHKSIPHLHVIDSIPSKPNSPAIESDDALPLNRPVFNTNPKQFNNFESNLNAQAILHSPENYENHQHNANSLNNFNTNHQNIAKGNLNSILKPLNNDHVSNNVNQINLLHNQNQLGKNISPQSNPPIEGTNLDVENSIPFLNILKNKVITQNLPLPTAPLQINNMNLKINEVTAVPNNINHFYNMQKLPNINFNDQTLQKDTVQKPVTNNNNNFVVDIPNGIPNKVENNELGMFDQRYPIPISNHVPFNSNTNIPTVDRTSEITFHNLDNNVKTSYSELNPVNQNNNILSIKEAPVTTLASRNPFLNWYKSPANKITNSISYHKPDSINAQNEIDVSTITKSYLSSDNVEIQPSISNQNVGNFYTLPKVITENPSSPLVSQEPIADTRANYKQLTLPSFTPKITSVFHNVVSANPSSETKTEKLQIINRESSSNFNFPKTELPSVSLTPEFIINKGDSNNPYINNAMKYQQKLSIDLGHVPNTNLPPVSQTPEFEIAKSSFVNPYFHNGIDAQKSSPEASVGQLPVRDVLLSNTSPNSQMDNCLSLPQTQLHPSHILVPQSNVVYPNLNNAVNLQQSVPQVGLENFPTTNPGSLPLSVLQQMSSQNSDPHSSFSEIPTSQIVPSSFYNNINPQTVLNDGKYIPATQSSQDFIPNVQTKPYNIVNFTPNYVGPFTQEQLLHSNYKIPADVSSSIQTFDVINDVEPVTQTPSIEFTPYVSPFNSVFNTIQSVPSYSNNVLNNVVTIDPIPPQDNSITPLYHSEPQTVFIENPYLLSSTSIVPNVDQALTTNTISTQPNTIQYSTPYYPFALPHEVVNTSPLYISPTVQEHTSLLNIPLNAQEFASIPEVTTSFNSFNQQNVSPRVAITQKLPFIPQNNINQYPYPGFLSSVSHLPNVYTSNVIQQILPTVQHLQPTVSYTNVTPNNLFPQVSELFPATGIVNSINDATSLVAQNVLTNLISKKLNSKTPQYMPIASLPPVNPYVPPPSYYSTPNPVTYDQVIPFISTLPTPNINSGQYPINSHSYEDFEIPDYYNDDYITDLSTTSLFAEIPEIPDVPDMDYNFENEMTPFIPYMSSLKVNILPIIEDVNLEPILPNNILIDAYPNMSPSFLPSTNIPYPVGPQVVDIPALQSLTGKKCRDVKDLERLISLFVLSELINGN